MSTDDPQDAVVAPASPAPALEPMPEWLATHAQAEANRVGRNDLCPCRSGLKFKRCCQRRLKATNLRQSFRPIPPTRALYHLPAKSKYDVTPAVQPGASS